jgi:hypothetical protein
MWPQAVSAAEVDPIGGDSCPLSLQLDKESFLDWGCEQYLPQEYTVCWEIKNSSKSGMVAHAYNTSNQEAGQEDHEFQVSLGYLLRSCFKRKRKQTKKKQKSTNKKD